MSGELARLVRFCLVGASNTALTLASFGALVLAGCTAPLASGAGFALGAANGYHWNARWTFAGSPRGRGVLGRYVAVQALGAGLSAGGVALLRHEGAARLAAELVIVPCVTVIAYCLSRLVVFRPPTA